MLNKELAIEFIKTHQLSAEYFEPLSEYVATMQVRFDGVCSRVCVFIDIVGLFDCLLVNILCLSFSSRI